MNCASSFILKRQTGKIKTECIGVRFTALLTGASYCKFPFVYHNFAREKEPRQPFRL